MLSISYNRYNIHIHICKYLYLYLSIYHLSIYRNIPNAEGISAVKRAFDNYSKETTTTKVVITFLALVLTLNNFVFDCIYYLQIKGCAVGTICALAYANIFMGNFELKYIYPYIKDKKKCS